MHLTKDWTAGLPSLGAQIRVNWRQKQALQVPSDPDHYPGASPEAATWRGGAGAGGDTPQDPGSLPPYFLKPSPKQESRGPGTLRIWKYCALGDESAPLSAAPPGHRALGLLSPSWHTWLQASRDTRQWHPSWAKIRGGQLCACS